MSVQISSDDDVPVRSRERAIDKIDRLIRSLDVPVLHTDLRLTLDQEPARERPAQARLLLDVNGEPVRVHVAATTIDEAVDLLDARLRRQLTSLNEYRQAMRRRAAGTEDGWRPPAVTERRPFYDRPAAEREIVRRKSFSTPDSTIDEAIFDLESMDYDFFLFTEAETGFDAAVWRTPEGTYGLRFANGEAPSPDAITTVADVELDPSPVPVLTTNEARLVLDETGDPWVLYRDPDTERARILYRRYDGHYGMLTPASE